MKNTKRALVLVLFVAVATIAAHAKTLLSGTARTGVVARPAVQVFVPGNASGYFGNPVDLMVPFVTAITVDGPGTITVTYVSGTVTGSGGLDTGPNGVPWNEKGCQVPLQEAHGIASGKVKNLAALIGVFVPESRVQDRRGFNALDGTKNVTRVGIMPGNLFFIGEGKTIDVKQAGTLYLGINDQLVGDNGGGFTVEVSGP